MKGISAVIATILMLMITVAMVGLAYMYISGIFTSRTAQSLSLSSIDCAGGDIHVMLKNDGTEDIEESDIKIYVDEPGPTETADCGTGTLGAGNTTLCSADLSAESTQGSHTVRIIGPANSITGNVYCAS